jgi:hypothetical protein
MAGGQVRLAATLAIALGVALAVWLLVSDGDEPSTPTEAPSPTAVDGPRLSEGGLVERAQSTGTPVYWVGPRDGVGYELTTTPAGRTFVRYLPEGVNPGDPRPDFLSVATYPLPSGLSALRRAGRESGGQTVRLPGGTLVFSNREEPTSAYLARPGWEYQVEVYHPKPGEALRIVLAGDVEEVG